MRNQVKANANIVAHIINKNKTTMKKTDKQVLQIVEKQLGLILNIANLQDQKNKAVEKEDYESVLHLRDMERTLKKEQMPFMEVYNLTRKQLHKKPIK